MHKTQPSSANLVNERYYSTAPSELQWVFVLNHWFAIFAEILWNSIKKAVPLHTPTATLPRANVGTMTLCRQMCLRSYNDTESANAGVKIECFLQIFIFRGGTRSQHRITKVLSQQRRKDNPGHRHRFSVCV